MIYEANASSSACRLRRLHQVETSTPPESNGQTMADTRAEVKGRAAALRLSQNLHNLVGLARCAGSAPFRGGIVLVTLFGA
jgi:hypothetical protein